MKMHLKRYKKRRISILNKIIVIISISLISSFFLIYYINKKVTPNIIKYATLETKKLATIIINRSVTDEAAKELDINKLIMTSTDQNGKITSVDFNSYIVNSLLSSIAKTVEENLKNLEEGKIELIESSDDVEINVDKEKLKKGIIYELPIGLVFKNALLTNIGPKIPIKLSLIGDIEVAFTPKITDYGINNALLELIINVKITEQVLLPISSEVVEIESDIPVLIKLIEGDVPEYYLGNGQSSKISIPIN